MAIFHYNWSCISRATTPRRCLWKLEGGNNRVLPRKLSEMLSNVVVFRDLWLPQYRYSHSAPCHFYRNPYCVIFTITNTNNIFFKCALSSGVVLYLWLCILSLFQELRGKGEDAITLAPADYNSPPYSALQESC